MLNMFSALGKITVGKIKIDLRMSPADNSSPALSVLASSPLAQVSLTEIGHFERLLSGARAAARLDLSSACFSAKSHPKKHNGADIKNFNSQYILSPRSKSR